MIQFIFLLFITSLWIWGVNCLFSEGHLFEKQGDWIHENLPEWIYKPTIGCAACMSSLHGILWFVVLGPICFDVSMHWKMLIPFLISLCGFNFLLIKLTSKERVIVEDE